MQVYADNAATTKISRHALDAMMPAFENIYGNPSSLHTVGQEAKEVLEDARERVAKCLGCEAREIYFTSGGKGGMFMRMCVTTSMAIVKQAIDRLSDAFVQYESENK